MNYLSQWKKATDERKGNFTQSDRGKMFLSKATFEGLQTTAHVLTECVQFLLQNGFQYVLTSLVRILLRTTLGDIEDLGEDHAIPLLMHSAIKRTS